MSFEVKVQPSGHVFEVDDEETVLEAALRQGFALPYGCRNGACGSCMGNLIAGEVDYGPKRPPALTEADEAAGRALFCQAVPVTDLEIEVKEIAAARDIEVKTLPSRVISLQRLAHDVMEMQLKLPASERLQFLAGQYVDILLKDGRRRSYSLANPPSVDDHLELHVRHVPGGHFSDRVFGELKEKALLRIQGPLGSFFLREDSERPIVLVGGGTGFAPLKAIIEHAFDRGVDRPMHLYWGVRARRDLYMDELARSWARDHEGFAYTPVLSEPQEGDDWQGRTGFVHEAVVADYPDLSAYEVYMSGPPPMIEAGRQAFIEHGLVADHLFYDSFEYAADARAGIESGR